MFSVDALSSKPLYVVQAASKHSFYLITCSMPGWDATSNVVCRSRFCVGRVLGSRRCRAACLLRRLQVVDFGFFPAYTLQCLPIVHPCHLGKVTSTHDIPGVPRSCALHLASFASSLFLRFWMLPGLLLLFIYLLSWTGSYLGQAVLADGPRKILWTFFF